VNEKKIGSYVLVILWIVLCYAECVHIEQYYTPGCVVTCKWVQYNLGNLTYIGPRYRWTTKNDGLLEKVGTNLLSCTAQDSSFRIDYNLTGFIIIYLFYIYKCVLWICIH
jgi:hypothetical protein